MAWSQDEIDALKTAIARGVLEVQHGETRTRYRSLAEMQRILSMMQSDVTTRTRSTVATFRSVR
jgi:hypothetical protein